MAKSDPTPKASSQPNVIKFGEVGDLTVCLCPALPEEGATGRQKLFLGTPITNPSRDNQIEIADSIAYGPPVHPSLDVYRSRNGNRIKLRTFPNIYVDMSINQRHQSWSDLFWGVKRSTRNTEYWDDLWYWNSCSPPPSLNRFIVMMACDLDANAYAAVSIRNDTSGWSVFASRQTTDPAQIREGYEYRHKWRYNISGSTLEFDIWNPVNDQGGWTGNDMIISWGRP